MVRMHNLPAPPTPLVGRDEEVTAARTWLQSETGRLVTLHGPAGSGKTRLALEVAWTLLEDFAHGVWFVDLAPIHDPDLVPATMAHVLGLIENAGKSPFGHLQEYLREKEALLVLDNFEQVLEAAPLVSNLLFSSRHLKILVTSRERLRLRGERRFPVRGLPVPQRHVLPPVEILRANPSVALFLQRAQEANPSFSLTEENARPVAETCVWLEGLPLSIELAAAPLSVAPQSHLPLIKRRLHLLTRGARDLPRRHRTLRGAIAWSYELLSPAEQALFRRLGVFTGGCTREAAEAVLPLGSSSSAQPLADQRSEERDHGPALWEGLEGLVEKSLLECEERQKSESRFRMLETIREYALEQLESSGEAEDARRAHAAYFVSRAEEAERALLGPSQVEWLNRLEREHDNVRVALHWAGSGGDVDSGLRLAGALWIYWLVRGHVREGRDWLTRLLRVAGWPSSTKTDRQQNVAPCGRQHVAKALFTAGFLAAFEDIEAAGALYEHSLAIWQALGDGRAEGWCLLGLGRVAYARAEYAAAHDWHVQALARFKATGDQPGIGWCLIYLGRLADVRDERGVAMAYYEEAMAMWHEVGDHWGRGTVLRHMANAAYVRGDYPRALALYDENLALFRALGFRVAAAWSLNAKGDVLRCLEDYEQAAAAYEEALQAFREFAIRDGIAWAHHNLAYVAFRHGNLRQATALFEEGLTTFVALGHEPGTMACLAGRASVAVVAGRSEAAAELLGAVEAQLERGGVPLEPADRIEYERTLAAVEETLGNNVATALRARGRTMTPAEAIASRCDVESAFSVEQPASVVARQSPRLRTAPTRLSEREQEVLRLVAAGLSNDDIAAKLVVEKRTVESHLTHICHKLGLPRRAVVAQAREILGRTPGQLPE